MIHIPDLRMYVIQPPLKKLNLYSEAAEELLIGTVLQESLGGKYLEQHGPHILARGIYQMEAITFNDIRRWMRTKDNGYYETEIITQFGFSQFPSVDRLITDLEFATVMTRLHYFRMPEKLPAADDIEGLANYWKKYYNTSLGKGTTKEFIQKYKKYAKK